MGLLPLRCSPCWTALEQILRFLAASPVSPEPLTSLAVSGVKAVLLQRLSAQVATEPKPLPPQHAPKPSLASDRASAPVRQSFRPHRDTRWANLTDKQLREFFETFRIPLLLPPGFFPNDTAKYASTLHPTPYTLHPQPCILNPTPQTLNSEP